MGLWAERACMGGVVGKHRRKGVERGVGAPVVVAVPERDLNQKPKYTTKTNDTKKIKFATPAE